jgi:hypothetical protein
MKFEKSRLPATAVVASFRWSLFILETSKKKYPDSCGHGKSKEGA